MPLLSLVTWTFDLHLQTHPSEGSNVFVWFWRKSVQRFPRYFICKQKTTDWRRHKQNLTQFTACSKNVRVWIQEHSFQVRVQLKMKLSQGKC